MKSNLLAVFRSAYPLALGALGGLVATLYPAAHSAFCSGALL